MIFCIKVGDNSDLECQSVHLSHRKCHYSVILNNIIEKCLLSVSLSNFDRQNNGQRRRRKRKKSGSKLVRLFHSLVHSVLVTCFYIIKCLNLVLKLKKENKKFVRAPARAREIQILKIFSTIWFAQFWTKYGLL